MCDGIRKSHIAYAGASVMTFASISPLSSNVSVPTVTGN
jgi:hypothetical protein